jgi:hypothetical protein
VGASGLPHPEQFFCVSIFNLSTLFTKDCGTKVTRLQR